MKREINGKEVYVADGQFANFVGDNVYGGIDWKGQLYTEGDWVIYAVGAGQGQAVAYGKVLKTILKDTYGSYEYKVQVQTYMTSANWNNGVRSRPAYVNPMNITVITKDQQDVFDAALERKAEEDARIS